MLQIAILMGGLATGLYPITKNIPKSMIEVAGEPFTAQELTDKIEEIINE